MGDRFASHPPAEVTAAADEALGEELSQELEQDWISTIASLDDCDGYVVLMIDPQTGEVDAHGPHGGPEATVVAESLSSSLASEGLDDVVVRVVRLHLPTASSHTG